MSDPLLAQLPNTDPNPETWKEPCPFCGRQIDRYNVEDRNQHMMDEHPGEFLGVLTQSGVRGIAAQVFFHRDDHQ